MLDDDVWGSDSEGDHPGRPSTASELDHEWQARQSQFHTLGYRDGVEAGKNSSAQEGFNAGYAEATTPGFTWGVARGLCSAFAALPASLRENLIGDEEARVRLDGLASSIHSFSSSDAQRSFYRDLNRDGGSGAEEGETRGVAEASTGGELGFSGLAEAASGDELGLVGINRLPESHGVGVWESENSSSRASSGASELEELEKYVRREFERASIKVSL